MGSLLPVITPVWGALSDGLGTRDRSCFRPAGLSERPVAGSRQLLKQDRLGAQNRSLGQA